MMIWKSTKKHLILNKLNLLTSSYPNITIFDDQKGMSKTGGFLFTYLILFKIFLNQSLFI